MTKEEIMERAKVAFDGDERILKWIEALLSGDFKQTEGALCIAGSFCCIGVAGRVILKVRERDITTVLPPYTDDFEVRENQDRVHISNTYTRIYKLLQEYGLSGASFAHMNDVGYNFPQIAEALVTKREDVMTMEGEDL